MNRRKYTNDPSVLLKEGKEIMLSHDDTRYYFRVFSVNFVLNGMAEISRVLKDGGIFYNAVISKEKLDKFFYTKNGFKKFTKDEYIELGKKAGFQRIRIKALGDNYGLLIIYRK